MTKEEYINKEVAKKAETHYQELLLDAQQEYIRRNSLLGSTPPPVETILDENIKTEELFNKIDNYRKSLTPDKLKKFSEMQNIISSALVMELRDPIWAKKQAAKVGYGLNSDYLEWMSKYIDDNI